LDVFFGNVYKYYCQKGFVPTVATGASDVVTLGFTVIFSTFLLSWVNWGKRFAGTCSVHSRF
jgi:autophagy-related protein 9